MTRNVKSSAANRSPAKRYLELIHGRIRAIRRDIPSLIDMGEKMAAPMLAGGRFFIPKVAGFWPREFGGRAGGLMGMTRRPGLHPSRTTDVAYVTLPNPRTWDPKKDAALTRLLKGKAHIFVNGREDELDALGSAGKRVAAFTGGAAADKGLYALGDRRPLAGLRHFDQFVRGWMAAGELIGACIRHGKMPTIYMSVWLEGAFVRNASFVEHHNHREPWSPPFFHRNVYIPPLAPGHVAGSFLDIAEGHLKVLQTQLPRLAQAGEWMAEARRQGRRIWAVATGHSYPGILELPEDGSYPIEWGRSISDLRKALPADLKAGDVVLHLGYAPVDTRAVAAILKKGIRLVHTSPYGRPATLPEHKNFIWLDLPWRPADASVDVPGYSVRILPMSSTCHTMAYFAILSEIAERMGWK
jgi:hypothetical protein